MHTLLTRAALGLGLGLMALGSGAEAFAQERKPARIQRPRQRKPKTQEELKDLRAKTLAKDVFHKAPWQVDYDKAREQAKKQGKLLFTYFTRSYAL